MVNLNSNIPNLLLLIRPNHFGYNEETAHSNAFQQKREALLSPVLLSNIMDGVIEALTRHHIPVKVFEDLKRPLPDAVFSNNWISVTPAGDLTVYPMYAPNRRAEVRTDIVNWVLEHTRAKKLLDLRTIAQPDQFLEGTGSIVFDHLNRKAYACDSVRTSISLFEKYCEQLAYTPISFESLDLNGKQIYHTNVMMSVAEKYCLINVDSIENQLERSFCVHGLRKDGKEIIPLTYAQMNSFAGNVLEVMNAKGESCLIMSETAWGSLTPIQIKQIEHYSIPVLVDVKLIEEIGGGGIRCMLTGLFQ